MTTTLYKSDALPALQRIVAVTEKRNTIPILANVAMSVTHDACTFVGTDMDIEVTVTVPCVSDTEWQTTVNAADLAKAFGKAKDNVTLDYADNVLGVSFGKAALKFNTLDYDDYPVLANADYETTFEMSGVELADIMTRAVVAVSTEETRYYLNGVYLHSVDGKLTAVATDGSKLAKVSTDIEQDIAGVIIPNKTVNELKKIEADTVKVSISDTKARFEFGDTVLTSKVVDGTYPDYSRVIPSENRDKLTLDGKELKEAVGVVGVVADGKTRAIKFDIVGGVLTLSARNPTTNDTATYELDCEFSGEDISIGFNSAYVIDISGQVGDGGVVFELGGTGAPARVVSGEGDGFVGVIMPLRV